MEKFFVSQSKSFKLNIYGLTYTYSNVSLHIIITLSVILKVKCSSKWWLSLFFGFVISNGRIEFMSVSLDKSITDEISINLWEEKFVKDDTTIRCLSHWAEILFLFFLCMFLKVMLNIYITMLLRYNACTAICLHDLIIITMIVDISVFLIGTLMRPNFLTNCYS